MEQNRTCRNCIHFYWEGDTYGMPDNISACNFSWDLEKEKPLSSAENCPHWQEAVDNCDGIVSIITTLRF